jgi:hypothetical protein
MPQQHKTTAAPHNVNAPFDETTLTALADDLTAGLDPSGLPSPIQLELLLVYEDVPTALRAKRAVDHVLDGPETRGTCRIHAWNLEELRDPTWSEHATKEALAADIVVVSTHGNDPLPSGIADHLKHWIGLKRGSPSALIISLDSNAKLFTQDKPELTELCFAASRTGMTVLLHTGEPLHPVPTPATTIVQQKTAHPQGHRNRRSSASLESAGHWGINE